MKEDENELNTYGQNFAGLYCECNRPYPDPEDSTIDEMIQVWNHKANSWCSHSYDFIFTRNNEIGLAGFQRNDGNQKKSEILLRLLSWNECDVNDILRIVSKSTIMFSFV